MYRYKRLNSILAEADEPKSDLKSKIADVIKKEVGVAIIEPKDSYIENKDEMKVRYSFIVPMEPSNMYCDIVFSDNEVEAFVRFDERDEKQIASYRNNKMVIFPKSIPITETLVNVLDKIYRMANTTLKTIILDGIGGK